MSTKSYERRLIEFITDIVINDVDVQAAFDEVPGITATEKYIVQSSINEEDPPQFLIDEAGEEKVRGVFVLWVIKPAQHDDKRTQAINIVCSVGHRDEDLIDLGNGHSIQRGKVQNADLAEKVGVIICKKLTKNFEHRFRCNLDIEQLIDNFFPNFVHQINILATYPKNYREPLF